MIAKIAYCVAVAAYGLDAIAEAFVLPAILGKRDDLGRWMGSDDYKFELEDRGALHAVANLVRPFESVSSGEVHRLILVKVKLFANVVGHSGYQVVVGRLREKDASAT